MKGNLDAPGKALTLFRVANDPVTGEQDRLRGHPSHIEDPCHRRFEIWDCGIRPEGVRMMELACARRRQRAGQPPVDSEGWAGVDSATPRRRRHASVSPRTPVIPLVLALALWAVGLASSSRALERSAAAPPAATWLHDAPAHPADGAALAVDLLAAGDAVTPAEARRGTGESLEGPISADAPGGREAGPPPAHTARPAHGRSPGPLYLHKRSLRC